MDTEQSQHFSELFQIHRRKLHELELQVAKLGLLAPPHMRLEITDINSELTRISAQLGMAQKGLRPPVPDFTGRDDEVERVVQILIADANDGSTALICGIRGMGGVGKTQLALAVAQRLKSHFPDGEIRIQLKGMSKSPVTSAQALGQIIRLFNPMAIPPEDIEQLEDAYHTELAGKRILILADDAASAVQVQSLFPPGGCALIITSRYHFTFPGMNAINLGTLPPKQAETLLLNICPRIGDFSSRMAELCGYLPLALRISAGLLATDDTRNVVRYLELLANERMKLSQLRDPDNSKLDVEATIRLSYEALEPKVKTLMHQLSVFSSSFSLEAAQAIIDIKEGKQVEDILGLLRRRSLIEWDTTTEMYSLHDLIRAYGVVHLNDNGATLRRLNRYYQRLDADLRKRRIDVGNKYNTNDKYKVDNKHQSTFPYPFSMDIKSRIRFLLIISAIGICSFLLLMSIAMTGSNSVNHSTPLLDPFAVDPLKYQQPTLFLPDLPKENEVPLPLDTYATIMSIPTINPNPLLDTPVIITSTSTMVPKSTITLTISPTPNH